MKHKFVRAFMDVAKRFAQISSAKRLQVGAIVVKDDRIISIGYNGMPAGWNNNCEYEREDGTLKSRPEVLHAERNALDKLARTHESGEYATMFVTHAPCLECAKSVYGAGITTLYYENDYRSDEGLKFLNNCGVNIHKLETSPEE
jgi:dCMP deaminase